MQYRFQLLTLLLFLSLMSGCGALEELDKAKAKLPASKKAAKTAPGAAAAPTTNPLVEQSKEWWGRATSLAPTDLDASIVNCRIGQNAQFMSKDDCLSRGGVPQGQS